ncbi:MAG: putative molybdenum carrier protein [Planctomycetes bacterium]|nr:putative molybdenum carrier protein [Planctomycetota bacterium]MBL7042612.1 putative molybdenum carrier protein [Pirellulaceae bacterium]
MGTHNRYGVRRIVSGGQTGVDRAALDAAIALDLKHGGWCPRGRLAEDGRIPKRYRLNETESPEYPVRTEQNVVDSDGTLILYRNRLVGGTELTRRFARKHNKPCCLVDLGQSPDIQRVRQWLADHSIEVLNVAGPRESSSPGIGREAHDCICSALSEEKA